MVENATMIPEGVVLVERKVRFLVRQCIQGRQDVYPPLKPPSIDPAHKRWYEFIAFFCISFFVASGNAAELPEPIDAALSRVAFLASLAIEPAPSIVLALIGRDSGQYQPAQVGRPLVQHH